MDRTDTLWCDTVWGAVLQIRKAGVTQITAYNEGSEDYRAVYAIRPQRILKAPQTITLIAPDDMDMGDTATIIGSVPAGLPLFYFISGGDSAAAKVVGDTIIALQEGIVRLNAYQAGNDNYEAAQAEQDIHIHLPNNGKLMTLHTSGGVLSPAFDPDIKEYGYTPPCSADTLTFTYDYRNTATLDGESVENTFVVKPFPEYGAIEIAVITPKKEVKRYDLRVRTPLPKHYIYYSPDKFANRMEVVNNPIALNGKRFNRYRWYENGALLPYDTAGVLYRGNGFTIGNVYSAMAYYDESTVYMVDSVYICGQTAVKAYSGLEVYPNPAASQITVRHPALGQSGAPIEIYTTSGSKAASYNVPATDIAADNSIILDISNLQSGAYVVKFGNASVVIIK
jgi:hypothetical protein